MGQPTVVNLKLRSRPACAVGIPSLETIPRTAFWPFMLMAQSLKPDDELLFAQETAYVAEARNGLVKMFLERTGPECEYLFMFDSDMVVPVNIIDLFIGYRLPFISAYCTRKTWPFQPIPAYLKGTREQNGETVYEYTPATDIPVNSGIHECDGIGAAAICIRRDMLERMEPPWFKQEGGGEDYYFCRKLRAMTTPSGQPVKILVDTHTQVGHIGESVATPETWFHVKPEYLAATGNTEEVLAETERLLLQPV